MAAKLINRREPLIALKTFKFMRREYNEGDFLDRRRVKMKHRNVIRHIDEGKLALAKELPRNVLARYGYRYDTTIGRYPLHVLSDTPVEEIVVGEIIEELAVEEDDGPIVIEEEFVIEETLEDGDDDSSDATTKHIGGGWYDIMVDGDIVNDKRLRKDEAIQFCKEWNEGE